MQSDTSARPNVFIEVWDSDLTSETPRFKGFVDGNVRAEDMRKWPSMLSHRLCDFEENQLISSLGSAPMLHLSCDWAPNSFVKGVAFVDLHNVFHTVNHVQSLPQSTMKLSLVGPFEHGTLAPLKDLPNLRELTLCLSEERLSHADLIGGLTNLTALHFERCNFAMFPPALVTMTHLKELSFVESTDSRTMEVDFGAMTHLEKLNIRSNLLDALPLSICKLKALKHLILSHNSIESLPEDLCQLTNLEILDLSNNNLESLPRAMYQLINLKELHLNCNFIGDDDVPILCKLLRQSTNLHYLDLSTNRLMDSISELLCAIESNVGLRSLRLAHAVFGDHVVDALSRMLLANRTLTQLDLKGITISIFQQDAVQLCKSFLGNVYLQKLDLSDTMLSDDAVTVLCEFLRKNTSLKDLSLAGCYISQDASELLFSNCDLVERLNINVNPIDIKGSKALAALIMRTPSLKYLKANWLIGSMETPRIVLNSLPFNFSLTNGLICEELDSDQQETKLVFSRNRILHDHVKYMCKILIATHRFRKPSCFLGKDCIKLLAKATLKTKTDGLSWLKQK